MRPFLQSGLLRRPTGFRKEDSGADPNVGTHDQLVVYGHLCSAVYDSVGTNLRTGAPNRAPLHEGGGYTGVAGLDMHVGNRGTRDQE